MKHIVHLFAVIAIAFAATGCRTGNDPVPESVRMLSEIPYPAEAESGGELDMLVIREGNTITLTNRTPRAYHNVQLWLNQAYVNIAPTVKIGPDNTYSLHQFIDRHRDHFPTAQFLKPDAAAPVVLAELYVPATNRRYQLTTLIGNQKDMMRRAR